MMNARELIEKLSQLDPDTEVIVHDSLGGRVFLPRFLEVAIPDPWGSQPQRKVACVNVYEARPDNYPQIWRSL